jgi:hypothetical protein
MTNDVHGVPTQRASVKRRLASLGVGVGVLAVVALPLGFAGFAALASFSGCFLECSEPEPLVGALWAGIALFLLAVPVVAGLVTARVLTAPGWSIALGLTAVFLGFVLGPRILNETGRWLFSLS